MDCSPCQGGYCGMLPGAELLPASSLDAPLQAAIAASSVSASSPLPMRGFNPSVVHWRGRRFLFARASNITFCGSQGGSQDGKHEAVKQDGAVGLAVSSSIIACDFGEAGAPAQGAAAQRCRELPVDVAALAARVPGASAVPGLQGVEDPRAFVHGGQPHLLVTFHIMQPDKRFWGRRRQWWEAEAPLQSHMAVLRLSEGLEAVDSAVVLQCAGLHSMRQKNWMHLPIAQPIGEALFVTNIQPFTVVSCDLETGFCRLVHGPEHATGSSSRGGGPGSPIAGLDGCGGSLQGSASEGGAASLAAVLGGTRLHGGSSFVRVGSKRYLSIAHHKEVLPYGRVYTHHWVLLEGGLGGAGELRVAWVSEGFRLPDMPGVRPSRDVQFASSLTLQEDELLIGYELARVPGFSAQLAAWLQRGLGTQPVSPAPTAPAGGVPGVMRGALRAASSSPAIIRWEASLFGREERCAEAAAAVGTGWQGSALPAAGARLLLRHLDQRPGPRTARQLAGLPLVTSNEQSSVPADVAISHARLEDLVPAVAAAWLPWVPRLGTSAPAAAVELLRRHASRVLVPTAFHRASLVQLLGFTAQQVAVLPQALPGDDLCPTGFDALPGRHALQELGGPPAAAGGVVFLHQTPQGWQYGAATLLEAYARTFSVSDNVMLVLHQQPAADDTEGSSSSHSTGDGSVQDGSSAVSSSSNGSDAGSWPVGSLAWAAAAGSPAALAERVAALALNASAPRVLLLARTPRFGRWADKLLQAADVAVLPYLGGTAGRELARATSCGRAVVTSAAGPAADALGQAAWLVPAKLQRCPLVGPALQGGAARTPLGCLQISLEDLGRALRQAWQSAEERQRRGAAAMQAAAALVERSGWDALADELWDHVQEHLAWPQAA
ncbi:hypothetical protein ABPG77_002174 [Micractinium sp. CCAP 211/92]